MSTSPKGNGIEEPDGGFFSSAHSYILSASAEHSEEEKDRGKCVFFFEGPKGKRVRCVDSSAERAEAQNEESVFSAPGHFFVCDDGNIRMAWCYTAGDEEEETRMVVFAGSAFGLSAHETVWGRVRLMFKSRRERQTTGEVDEKALARSWFGENEK